MHWIDKAEQSKNKRENSRKEIHTRIDHKKDDVIHNWDKNKDRYLTALNKIQHFINRINNLPRESRLEFGRIESKEKNSSLQNHLVKYTSSRRRVIRKFDGLFSPFKAKHYKNTRNIFISLSRKVDYVLIETKEITAPRIRLNEEVEGSFSSIIRYFKRKERSIIQRAKTQICISELNESFALYLIDFLAFKNNGKEYFFTENTSKELEEH
jgi:hypothetical protein